MLEDIPLIGFVIFTLLFGLSLANAPLSHPIQAEFLDKIKQLYTAIWSRFFHITSREEMVFVSVLGNKVPVIIRNYNKTLNSKFYRNILSFISGK